MKTFLKEKIGTLCKNLKVQSRKICGEIGSLEYAVVNGYKKNDIPPEEGWKIMTEETRFQGKDSHFWVRGEFHTPKTDEYHYLVLEATTGKEGRWDATNPQGLLYLNGKMEQGYDTNHTEAFLDSDTAYVMHNYMYLGMHPDSITCHMKMYSIDKRIEKLYYDFFVPYETCLLLDETSNEYIKIMMVLEQAANLLDLRDIYSDMYFESIAKADEWLEKELYGKLCCKDGKPIVNYLGHTHIDVEWLWTRRQTREKIQRSVSTAVALMKKYPEFKFMLTQPELYQYLKEEAPEKYEEVKALVKEGRWEPEGAMWVEADCNLTSGESLVRQILQGKSFLKEEFGVDCKLLFLPDVFGYSAAMPQILKKCGVEYFITSKISWNETNKMPVDAFMWQGIDGTEIFTSFITTQNYIGLDAPNHTTYVGIINSAMHKGAWHRFQQKDYSNRVITTFGFGDGGGGPTKDMLEQYRRLEKGLPGMPVAEMDFMEAHIEKVKKQFDENCKKIKRVPKWIGELYLEFHRGTYTSMARNKKNNRESEQMIQKVEAISYTDFVLGGTYDVEGIHKTWKKILHNQFHDILPGTSIYEVYEGTDLDYREIKEYCHASIQNKLGRLAECVEVPRGILIYNSLGFKRTGMLKWNDETIEIEESIPAFGWKVVPLITNVKSDVKVDGNNIHNRYYKLCLDNSGRICSLYDLRVEREVFISGTFGNEFQAFEDLPYKYDAWEISEYYKQKMWVLDESAEITPIFDGSRAGLCVVKRYLKSTIKQKIWLYTNSPRIDFETEIDWHEKHQLLKVAFPMDMHVTSATYEIQYGHVIRPTHENTSWERAKFESCGHKWVDMSENGYGVSVLNDCKYGYNTEGSTLKITLLKCATDPNPHADEGIHSFTYSLLPHTGDFREAGVINEAYSLNQPLEQLVINPEKKNAQSVWPTEFSLVSVDQPNVIVETIKKAEVDQGMIVRMYEAFDRRGKVTVTVGTEFKKAYLCDLLENVLQELPVDKNTVKLSVSNFEIITLKFTK